MRNVLRHSCLILALIAGLARGAAAPAITEFMASNKATLKDEDGDYSDWIELHNPDAAPVNLDGWYLTDSATNKTKWTIPAVTLPADGYLVIFASDKNRRDPAKTLHTNFGLSAGGEYLALVRVDGVTVASEYAAAFPAQSTDVSYGVTQPTVSGEAPQNGYFGTPTPGVRNGGADTLTIMETVGFSRPSGLFTGSTDLELSGAVSGQTIRYAVTDTSTAGGLAADPDATSPAYTAALSITKTVVIKAAVFSADGTRHGRVTSAHYLKLDDRTTDRLDTFSSQLPLLVLDNLGFGPMVKDEIGRPAWLYGFRAKTGVATVLRPAADYTSRLEMEVRGATSSLFPKKSYKFDLVDDDGHDAPLALFGLASLEDWNLVGPWSFDQSYIRNSVVYELSRRMGHWAPRTQLVEVFSNLNGDNLDASDYAGIYVLTDKLEIDPARINLTKISAGEVDGVGVTGGYLLRADGADPEKYYWTTDHGSPEGDGSFLMVEEPKAAKLPQAQRDYIRTYVQQMENALYADHESGWATRNYLDYLDRPSWVDYHLINTFVKNTDAFWRSTYFTKDRDGRIFAGPVWDYDRSMDSTDPRDDHWDTWEPTRYTAQGFAVQYWDNGWWGVLARDPDFMQAWVDRWQSLRRSEFSDANLAGLVSNFASQIGSAAAARDAARWPDNQSVHGDFAAEIDHLSKWLTQRARWIDGQFIAAPVLKLRAGTLTVVPAAGTVLAYTLDGTDPRRSGGELAPGALTSEAPLSLQNFALLRVRSYAADHLSAFPGSPWSALQTPEMADDPNTPPDDSDLPVLGLTGGTFDAVVGKGVNFSVLAVGIGPFAYQWYKDGTAIPNATNDTLALSSVKTSDAGSYVVKVTNEFGTVSSSAFELQVTPANRLVNISARAEIGTGENILIAGFVVPGGGARNFLARAVGATLHEQGVVQTVVMPTLSIVAHDGSVLASNTKWSTNPDAARIAEDAAQVGAFPLPAASDDAALLANLSGGIHTLHVSPGDATGGIGLVELYALDENSYPVNLSARARVRSGEKLLIGGFVIAGSQPQRVLIRAVGPTLSGLGVLAPLRDPQLDIVSGGKTVFHNDDWESGDTAREIATAATAVGAFPLTEGSRDSAMLVTLPAGVYTALVTGKNDAEGVALLEIYAVEE